MKLVLVGVPFLVHPAAEADTVSMQLVAVTPSGANMGGVFTGPYEISVDGSTLLPLTCDDFKTDISVNYSWTATTSTLADVANGTDQPKFSGGVVYLPGGAVLGSYTAYQEYYAAAVLVNDLLSVLSSSQAAKDYSYAVWQIFDPTAYLGYAGSKLSSTDQANVTAAMQTAFSLAVPSTGSPSPLPFTLDIYTPCGGAGGCGTPGQYGSTGMAVSQEFLGISALQGISDPPDPRNVSVPEGTSTLSVLAIDLLALFACVFLVRRLALRKARP